MMDGDAVTELHFEDAILRNGHRILRVWLGLSITFVIAVAWFTPAAVPFLPLVLLAGIAGWYVFRRPVLNLCCLMVLFPLVADFEEGIEVKEVLFGLYLAVFLSHWYFHRFFLSREKLLQTSSDYLASAILWTVLCYLPISFVFGGEFAAVRSEFIAMISLAVYFPAKAAVKDNPRGVFMIFVALLCIGLFVTARNIYWMRELVSQATTAWQITQKARIVSNEILLVVPATAMLAWSLHLKKWREKGPILLAFLAMAIALVITQSRGFWAAFALGCLIMLIGLGGRERKELVAIGVVSLTLSSVFVFLFFSDAALLLFAGMFNRILSLGSAVSSDISLLNRFLEGDAVLSKILENPILGYGFGVPYQYYNITISGTRDWSFIHNGYLGLWYRFGVFGAGLVLVFWGQSILHAFRLARQTHNRWFRMAALTSLAVLGSLLLSNSTSNAFFHMDSLFMFALLTGMVAGLRQSVPTTQNGGRHELA